MSWRQEPDYIHYANTGQIRTHRVWVPKPRKVADTCKSAWACCPGFLRVFVVFFVANIAGDLLAFPFVHTFWNIVNFEGWYTNE